MLTAFAVAQTPPPMNWSHANVMPTPSGRSAIAYDAARERTVMVNGQGDTWEWDGAFWTRRHPQGPAPRTSTTLAYDLVRRHTVMLGGPVGNETWEWDGSTWARSMPFASPTPRNNSAMTYDPVRQRVLMFGGNATQSMSDTWEWDGSTWIQRQPASAPPPRWSAGLVYDVSRQRVVLFGGLWGANIFNPIIPYDDTWEWDGTDWVQRFPLHIPERRGGHVLVYDPARQRSVMYGGCDPGTILDDTWEWDGTDWRQVSPMHSPGRRSNASAAYDAARQRVVLFSGGETMFAQKLHSDTWVWDGTDWQRLSEDTSPPTVIPGTLAFDSLRSQVVLFGGAYLQDTYDGTWEWDGGAWTFRFQRLSPPGRARHAMAYDVSRGRTVMFGGSGNSSYLDDTWEWDGDLWTQQHPVVHPPAWPSKMTYDTIRQRVVLSSYQTWEWDGTAWTRVLPAHQAPMGLAMAYDESRRRTVLLSNTGWGNGAPDEVWEYDGADWSQRLTNTAPSVAGGLAYHAGRRRTVLVGQTVNAMFAETWEWDGAQWTPLPTAVPLPLQVEYPIVYDRDRQQVVLFDGTTGGTTWFLDSFSSARASSFGLGCPGTGGVPALAGNEPYLGNEGFTLEVQTSLANAPCLIGLSAATATTPLGGGCTLYLLPPIVPLFAVANAFGCATVRASLGRDPGLRGLRLFAQAVVLDPFGSSRGVDFTQGRELVLGN